MRLLHVSLLSILALPITARATSFTYTVEDGNTPIFQFVTGNFIPYLPQFITTPTGGSFSLHMGQWTICALSRVTCAGANFNVIYGQTGAVVDDYDAYEGSIFPVYLGNFNTDLSQLGVFPDVHLGTRTLIVTDGEDPVSVAPEPSTWALGGMAMVLLFLGQLRRKFRHHLVRNFPIG